MKIPMNKLVGPVLICLIVTCSAAAQKKTDRENDRLIGPVKSVRVETAKLVNKSERWIERGRELERVISYDSQGNMTKQTIYTDRPTVTEIEYRYDKDGNRSENILSEGPPGASSSLGIGRTDGGGARGDGDRRVASSVRRVFKHDADGNRIEETMYRSRGTSGRIISGIFNHIYDQKQQRIETTLSDPALVVNKWVHTYDDKGNVLETAKYTRGGYLLIKESYMFYEFDSRGNWIKKTSSKLEDRKKSYFRPEEVTYRMISYY
jgi:hypothetical protein